MLTVVKSILTSMSILCILILSVCVDRILPTSLLSIHKVISRVGEDSLSSGPNLAGLGDDGAHDRLLHVPRAAAPRLQQHRRRPLQ